MNRLRHAVVATLGAALLAVPVANATARTPAIAAAVPKKKVVVVTKKVSGPAAQADRWGFIQVTLTIRKKTTSVGTKKTITRKIVAVGVPVYPNHTDRSVFINQQALPALVNETLQAQSAHIQMVSGRPTRATRSSSRCRLRSCGSGRSEAMLRVENSMARPTGGGDEDFPAGGPGRRAAAVGAPLTARPAREDRRAAGSGGSRAPGRLHVSACSREHVAPCAP